MTLLVKCPHCNNDVEWTPEYPFRPFCSERCKLIDLGAWAEENYKLPSDDILEYPDQPSEPEHHAD